MMSTQRNAQRILSAPCTKTHRTLHDLAGTSMQASETQLIRVDVARREVGGGGDQRGDRRQGESEGAAHCGAGRARRERGT